MCVIFFFFLLFARKSWRFFTTDIFLYILCSFFYIFAFFDCRQTDGQTFIVIKYIEYKWHCTPSLTQSLANALLMELSNFVVFILCYIFAFFFLFKRFYLRGFGFVVVVFYTLYLTLYPEYIVNICFLWVFKMKEVFFNSISITWILVYSLAVKSNVMEWDEKHPVKLTKKC